MYTLINIYSLPNTPNIIGNNWSWNNINNHWSKSNRQMIDSRYRWETPIWLHSLAALTKSSKTNWENFNVNIAMPFLFLVAEFEMTVLQIPFLFWWRSLAAFLVSSLASLSSQCGTSSSASRSLFTRSVPSSKSLLQELPPWNLLHSNMRNYSLSLSRGS